MRAFIAIELPDEPKRAISLFQEDLKKLGVFEGNWTSSYHLTLKFLHEISDQQVKVISGILSEIVEKTKKFELELKGIGAFPKPNYIRVLWIGAGIGDEAAKELQRKIDNKMAKLDFKKEKYYANHLTLARVKAVKEKGKINELFESYAAKSFGKFTVDKIKLIKSTLTTKGPVYETIREFSLSQA